MIQSMHAARLSRTIVDIESAPNEFIQTKHPVASDKMISVTIFYHDVQFVHKLAAERLLVSPSTAHKEC